VHAENQYYEPMKASLFFGPDFLKSLLEQDAASFATENFFIGLSQNSFANYHRIYCVYDTQNQGNSKDYVLLTLHPGEKSIELFDPRSLEADIGEEENAFMSLVLEKFTSLSHKLFYDFDGWAIAAGKHQYFETATVGDGSPPTTTGIEILVLIYFLVHDCPIYYSPSIIKSVRNSFCYWMMNELLPE